jgi:hypothetical protein
MKTSVDIPDDDARHHSPELEHADSDFTYLANM